MKKKKNRHIEHTDEKKLRVLSVVSFLFGFAEALLLYVTSDYFSRMLGSKNVSSFYFIVYVVALVGLLNMHKIVKLLGKVGSFFLFFMLQIYLLFSLIFAEKPFLGIILMMLYIIVNYFSWVILDVIIEEYSEDKKSGRIRGFHLMILSAGILLGPFLSTEILSNFDFDGLFTAALIVNCLMFMVGLYGLKGVNGRFRGKLTIKDIGMKVMTNKDVLGIYTISLVLEAFYALMIVYTPLYLLDRGISWQQIGIIFTVMLIPFVALEYPVGFLADKKFGEKEMIIGGLLIMGTSSFSVFFVDSNSVFVWSGILLLTRIGAATVETLRDSYFYKKIDGRDVDLISFFRTTRAVAYLLATGLSAMLLIIAPMKYIFILVACMIFAGVYPAFKLVDNKSEEELVLESKKKYGLSN
ncbi:MAG: MFS transporter [Candidatus Moranbacteria bacterium]|nr:MFS transporter [Candidatus Moranbacteria bacterium]